MLMSRFPFVASAVLAQTRCSFHLAVGKPTILQRDFPNTPNSNRGSRDLLIQKEKLNRFADYINMETSEVADLTST